MLVKTKRALWLGSAVTIAFAGFATVALAADAEKVKVTAGVEGIQTAQAETPPAPEAEEEKKVERVVVTGSRLRKNEFTSSAPIQVITREETTLEGLNDTGEILQGSTLASGSQQIGNTFGGFITQGGPGANTISLRGLGAVRTLVLVNGRRMSPAGTRGQTGPIDLNTIPESMIDRIEILKDGGSSIYGSDAVAGVINIITRKNVDGIELTAYANQPFDGGGEVWQGSVLWGETFDQGHFLLAGEYYNREALKTGDRDYFGCTQDLVFDSPAGTRHSTLGANSLLDVIDPATGQSKCFDIGVMGTVDRTLQATGASVAGNNFALGGRYRPDPTAVAGGGVFGLDIPGFKRVNLGYVQVANRLFPALVPNATVTANTAFDLLANAANRAAVESAWRTGLANVPTDNELLGQTDVISPATRYSLHFEGSYDVLPGIEAYTELAFNRRESEQQRFRQFFPDLCGTSTPANTNSNFFGRQSQTYLCGNVANPNNTLGQRALPIYLHTSNGDQTVDFYRGVLGFKGEFGDTMPIFSSWAYDLYGMHSRAEADYTQDQIWLDAVVATTGPAACIQSLILYSGRQCSSLPAGGIPWLDPTRISGGTFAFTPAERDFLFGRETGHTTFTESTVNGVITGDIWQAPYGMIAGAVGFEWRRYELDDTPGIGSQVDNLWGFTSAGRTIGSDSVSEVFGEVSIPLLAGMKFAEDLTLDASARYSSYDSYGDGSTYKLGLNYQITPEYRIRGTTGTSFRAPQLFELYLANQTGFLAQNSIDPCIQWNLSSNPLVVSSCGPGGLGLPAGYTGPFSSATIVTGGGQGLEAERSEARTVGFIWTPDWVDFSVGIDYWEFEVVDEIAQFGAANIVSACHTRPPQLANPFCTLYTRDTNPASPTFGFISVVNNSFVNISDQTTDGIDVTLRYERELSFGTLRINSDLTWTFTDEIRVFTGFANDDDNGEVYDADFTGSVDVRFDWTDWTFFWNVDMASRASLDEAFGSSVFAWRATPFSGYFKQYTEFVATHDLSARYRADDWAITFGVQNVFDDPPPSNSQLSAGRIGNSIALGGPYDLQGRRGFVEITKEF
jgi:iron complex outermembrane receptor protein